MGNGPFEDVFPIENRDFPLLCLITGVYQLRHFASGVHITQYNFNAGSDDLKTQVDERQLQRLGEKGEDDIR